MATHGSRRPARRRTISLVPHPPSLLSQQRRAPSPRRDFGTLLDSLTREEGIGSADRCFCDLLTVGRKRPYKRYPNHRAGVASGLPRFHVCAFGGRRCPLRRALSSATRSFRRLTATVACRRCSRRVRVTRATVRSFHRGRSQSADSRPSTREGDATTNNKITRVVGVGDVLDRERHNGQGVHQGRADGRSFRALRRQRQPRPHRRFFRLGYGVAKNPYKYALDSFLVT